MPVGNARGLLTHNGVFFGWHRRDCRVVATPLMRLRMRREKLARNAFSNNLVSAIKWTGQNGGLLEHNAILWPTNLLMDRIYLDYVNRGGNLAWESGPAVPRSWDFHVSRLSRRRSGMWFLPSPPSSLANRRVQFWALSHLTNKTFHVDIIALWQEQQWKQQRFVL